MSAVDQLRPIKAGGTGNSTLRLAQVGVAIFRPPDTCSARGRSLQRLVWQAAAVESATYGGAKGFPTSVGRCGDGSSQARAWRALELDPGVAGLVAKERSQKAA